MVSVMMEHTYCPEQAPSGTHSLEKSQRCSPGESAEMVKITPMEVSTPYFQNHVMKHLHTYSAAAKTGHNLGNNR